MRDGDKERREGQREVSPETGVEGNRDRETDAWRDKRNRQRKDEAREKGSWQHCKGKERSEGLEGGISRTA